MIEASYPHARRDALRCKYKYSLVLAVTRWDSLPLAEHRIGLRGACGNDVESGVYK